MREYRTGVRCEECGCPIPSRNVLGGGLCDECWDTVLAEVYRERSGQQFPDYPPEAYARGKAPEGWDQV
jgi:hypothetical protein